MRLKIKATRHFYNRLYLILIPNILKKKEVDILMRDDIIKSTSHKNDKKESNYEFLEKGVADICV
jgi:hypothetical protein